MKKVEMSIKKANEFCNFIEEIEKGTELFPFVVTEKFEEYVNILNINLGDIRDYEETEFGIFFNVYDNSAKYPKKIGKVAISKKDNLAYVTMKILNCMIIYDLLQKLPVQQVALG